MAAIDSKAQDIEAVLNEPVVDLWRLRELSLSEGGLVNDSLRKRAWPKLVGLHDLWSDANVSPSVRRDSKSASAGTVSRVALKGLPPRPPTRSIMIQSGKSSPESIKDEHSHTSDAASVSSEHSAASSHDYDDHDGPLVPQSPCLDADQISLDVLRCTWHLLTGTQRLQRIQMEHKRNRRVAKLIRKKQQRLALLINATLVQTYGTTNLRYYQGYHDVACIFLSALGGVSGLQVQQQQQASTTLSPADADLASAVLLRVSQHHLHDCLQTNFTSLQTTLRFTIFPLIALLDPEVHAHLYGSGMEPFFALSWVLTWFAHEVRDTETVKRLFDAFLVSHALLPVYMSVAMVIHPTNRQEVLDCECDFSLLHQTLRGLPKNSSMAGWKYRPGDGYVSDDDQADDNGTVSTAESGTAEAEFLLVERLDHDDYKIRQQQQQTREDYNTASLVSSNLSSMEPPAPVSFQELLDNAIDMMRRIPPHKLLGLAIRYYGKKQVDDMLSQCNVIYMFDPDLPASMVQSTAMADWLYKQEAKERKIEGFDRTTQRRERKRSRRRSPSIGGSPSTPLIEQDAPSLDEQIALSTQYIKTNLNTSAVIALGFGSGDDEVRKRRKRRKMVMSMAVVLLAVAVGVAMRYGVQETETHQGISGPQSSELKPSAAVSTIDTASASSVPNDSIGYRQGATKRHASTSLSDSTKNELLHAGIATDDEPTSIAIAPRPNAIRRQLADDSHVVYRDDKAGERGQPGLPAVRSAFSNARRTLSLFDLVGHEAQLAQESNSVDEIEAAGKQNSDFIGNKLQADEKGSSNQRSHSSSPVIRAPVDLFPNSWQSAEVVASEEAAYGVQGKLGHVPTVMARSTADDVATGDEVGLSDLDRHELSSGITDVSAQVVDLVTSISLPVWGLVRENCTTIFAFAKRLTIRETRRAQACLDFAHHGGLGAYLSSIIDDAHGLVTDNQVCKTRSDPIHVITRIGFGLAEPPTNGPFNELGQLIASASSSRVGELARHCMDEVNWRVRQFAETCHTICIAPHVRLLLWICVGLLEDIRGSSSGQRVSAYLSRVFRSPVSLRLRCKVSHFMSEAGNAVTQASTLMLYEKIAGQDEVS